MSRFVRSSCLLITLTYLGVPARAGGLVISVQDTSVVQGGTGTVDVFLTSTASSQTPDLMNNYAFQLQITNNGSDNTQLAFAANQNFGYISNTGLNPPYVFLGDSFDAQSPVSPVGSVGQTAYPNDTFTGADSTFSGNPVSLSSDNTYLLTSVTVTSATGAPAMLGDSFTISLQPIAGTGSLLANPNTYFDNFNFDTGTELSATEFTSMSGTVNIVGSAVPEPASIISGLTAVLIFAGLHIARRVLRWLTGRREANPPLANLTSIQSQNHFAMTTLARAGLAGALGPDCRNS